MTNTFLGLPMPVWGILCLAIAVLYSFIWPKPKPNSPTRPAWIQIVLRWFHALVWAFLALVCFVWTLAQPTIAQSLALFALLLYLVFLIAIASDRKVQQNASNKTHKR